MYKEDIYTKVLEYMCKNYDYSLYAADFNANHITNLQRSIASIPSTAGQSRIQVIKLALQDFFNAIYQRIFIYEDEERIKIVKYFDVGAVNENQDRQIHALRQELLKFKKDIENTLEKNVFYMFDKASRKRFEVTLLHLNDKPLKEMLREQINLVFELEKKDITIFLNERIFIKKFKESEEEIYTKYKAFEAIDDTRLTNNFLEVLKLRLNKTFENTFHFINQDKKTFYGSYPYKFKNILTLLIENAFIDEDKNDVQAYVNYAYTKFLPNMLEEAAIWLLAKVTQSELKAISFLKSYSESINTSQNNIKIKKQPLMDSEGNIYNFQAIMKVLKRRDLLISKLGHKKMEISKITTRVKKSQKVVQRSFDEMDTLQNRRLELLHIIETVENEISALKYKDASSNIDVNRLEFSKRDLLEAFKQVEIRIKTQNNILQNTAIELSKWEDKRVKSDLERYELEKEYIEIHHQYRAICEALSFSFSKEPLEL